METMYPKGTNLKHNYPLYEVKPFSSIREMLYLAAEEAPDTVAYKFKGEGGTVTEVTYSRFRDAVDALGTGMALHGIKNMHVGMIGENCYGWILAYLTTLCGDNVFVPIDRELPVREIINVVHHSDCEALFLTKSYADKLLPFADEMPAIRKYIVFGLTEDELKNLQNDKVVRAEDLIRYGGAALTVGDRSYLDARRGEYELKMLVYTSGTTGVAKGVMLSEHNLVSSVYYGMQISTIYTTGLSVLPYNHTYEAVCDILVSIHKHATLCINENLRSVAENLKLYKPDYIMLVPAFVDNFYKKIWSSAEATGKADGLRKLIKISSKLRKIGIDRRHTFFESVHKVFGGRLIKIVCGGAPIRPELAEFFDAIGITLINGYGITECSPLVSANRDFYNDYHTVGVPLPCVKIGIDNPNENGEGEITVSGDVVMMGYYKNPEATAQVLRDGVFYTGDYGRIGEDGRLTITGRKKNLIVLKNGKNVYPEEIEGYLENIPYIREVVVYALKNEDGDETGLCAEMFLDEQLTKDMSAKERLELMVKEVAKINHDLPSYKRIAKIKLRKTEFEKTTSRKIRRVGLGKDDTDDANV